MMSERTGQYPYIKAWGIYMGSYPYYIDGQRELAELQNAPHDAIYKQHGEWMTYSNIGSAKTKIELNMILDDIL